MIQWCLTALRNVSTHIRMMWIRKTCYDPFVRLTKDTEGSQIALLKKILHENRSTDFGKQHGFQSIQDYHDFKQSVSVHDYEDLRPFIEEQERTRKPVLNASQPIMYARTSGTTGQPKNIPILESTIKDYKFNQNLFIYGQHLFEPKAYSGKVLAMVSPDVEGTLETGTPYGSVSGLMYSNTPALVKMAYALPSEVFSIADYALKYYVICAFALREKNITMIATANPTTITRIKRVIDDQFDSLVDDIERGHLSPQNDIPEELRKTICRQFRPAPNRAFELKQMKNQRGQIRICDFWPELKLVSTWTSGNCQTLIPAVQAQLGEHTHICEMGYLSSEFRGTINLDISNRREVPTINENFFEFVDKNAWQTEHPKFLMLHQIEEGKEYYVFVTTQCGLYRYFMNDLVKVTGRSNTTPTIQFLQKGEGVTNLTGEKLYEAQVNKAVSTVIKNHGLNIQFYIMIAYSAEMRYRLHIEEPFEKSLAEEVEQEISNLNIEYREKRKSGRLHPLEVLPLKSRVAEDYKQSKLSHGQREGQYKLVSLMYDSKCDFDFSPYIME